MFYPYFYSYFCTSMQKQFQFYLKQYSNNLYITLFIRIIIILLLYSISRFLFIVCNQHYFKDISIIEYFNIFWGGFRFDISSVLMINSVFIILSILPLWITYNNVYKKVLLYYFYISNSFAILFNFTDIVYFRFTFKRTTSDIFNYMGVGGDFDKLLPQFLKDFWFIPIFWILSIWLFVFLNNKINFSGSYNKSLKSNLLHIFVFIIIIFSTVIGIRGGFQLRPLDIINAGKYSNSKNIPLVLNTPFTIIKTIGLPVLQKKEYYSNDVELNKIYSPFHLRNSISNDTSNYNVVIVIFESLSQEHIGALNNTKDYSGFTPFLDSLIKKSYVTSGFANGKRSIEGIPAILASIPTLMNEAYITSMYAGNKINSLASLLRSEGYNTSFFHGGSNGTMGFESFAKVAGFNSYYGRNQYNNETDYDGKWGIFDEPYFQYFANKLNETKQPFFSTIFTLSSHHPYTVPEKYKGKFKKGKLEIQESIMYADFSLRKFFETASKMPWFNKTIFVITADHTSEAYFDYYQNNIGMYSIPIIYYIPNNDSIRFTEKKLSQQTDIMPTVLGLVNFKGNYFSFGNDIFDSTQPNFSISYLNNEYQILKDGFVLRFDGKNSTALYNFKKDSLLKNNLINININQKVKLETFTKAVIQQYNNNMINNRMTNEK